MQLVVQILKSESWSDWTCDVGGEDRQGIAFAWPNMHDVGSWCNGCGVVLIQGGREGILLCAGDSRTASGAQEATSLR